MDATERKRIDRVMRAEAGDVYEWSSGAGAHYAEHAHPYAKLLYCLAGDIEFILRDGRRLRLTAGDRMLLPAGTPHRATVGPAGCTCAEGPRQRS